MFTVAGERVPTFNLVVGCLHNCVYCYARRWARRQRKRCLDCYNFKPHFHIERFEQNPPRKGSLPVFINDMGDAFGSWIPQDFIDSVIRYMAEFKDVTFYCLTKNPARYLGLKFPENVVLGATVETNIDNICGLVSDAPFATDRLKSMRQVEHKRKFISIEPILEFLPTDFYKMIKEVRPEFVYVGYCNPLKLAKKLELPEPPLSMTQTLIRKLKNITEVRLKTIRPAWYET